MINMEIEVKRTAKAVQRKIEMGKEVDILLIEHIKSNPSITLYEISKSLRWSKGKVQGSIKRVEHLLVVEEVVENAKFKKKYTYR